MLLWNFVYKPVKVPGKFSGPLRPEVYVFSCVQLLLPKHILDFIMKNMDLREFNFFFGNHRMI